MRIKIKNIPESLQSFYEAPAGFLERNTGKLGIAAATTLLGTALMVGAGSTAGDRRQLQDVHDYLANVDQASLTSRYACGDPSFTFQQDEKVNEQVAALYNRRMPGLPQNRVEGKLLYLDHVATPESTQDGGCIVYLPKVNR